MLRLEGVGKRYGRAWVLRSVDLEAPEGSLTVVRGPNGAGKSTLLRLVAGVSIPSCGAVTGRPSRVAVVPDRLVPPRMRARDYLRHIARLRGVEPRRAERRLADLAEQLSLVPGLDAPLRTLSGGNLQKVALAQAFVGPVDLLVLDEPQAALDDAASVALRRLVERARGEGAAVVVADHGSALGAAAVAYELDLGTLARCPSA